MKHVVSILAAAAALAAGASGQVASSPSFRLEGYELQGAGGGACSSGPGSISAAIFAGDTGLTSPGFQLAAGFLAAHDPLAGDEPAIFAVTPAFGPIEGGTQITICGLHFVQQGLAHPVRVEIAGTPASQVTVVSDSVVTAKTRSGPFGPHDVDLSTSLGATTVVDGFVHTPAVLSSPQAWRTGGLTLRNLGPPGTMFSTMASPTATSIPLPPFGTLLIGPSPLFRILDGAVYPSPDGVHEFQALVPDDPTLVGTTLYFQTVVFFSLSPVDVRLVNRSSTFLQ